MTSFNVSSAEAAIIAITAYEQDTKASVDNSTVKIYEFLKSNETILTVDQQQKIKELSGRLSDKTQKAANCKQLVELISAATKVFPAQQSHKLDDSERLKSAEASLMQTLKSQTKADDPSIKQLIAMTTERERLDLIKKVLEKAHSDVVDESQKNSDDDSDDDEGASDARLSSYLESLCQHVQSYQLSDSGRYEMAMLILDSHFKKTYSKLQDHLPRFQLSYAQRFEIAKKSVFAFSCNNMKIFDLQEAELLEIAKLLAKKSATQFLRTFLFEMPIFKEPDRFALAEIAVKEDSYNCCDCIKYFQLSDDHLHAIAKFVCSQEKPPSSFANNIKQFHLPLDERVRVAKLLAPHAALPIESFEIPDEEDRFAIAKIAAASQFWLQNPYEKPVNPGIKSYNFTSESKRAEIAMILAASQSTREILNHFNEFNLAEEKNRIAVANIIANRDPFESLRNFAKFNITNPVERLKLIRIALENFKTTHPCFGPDDQFTEAERIEIAYHFAKKNVGQLQYIKDYNFKDPALLVDILLTALRHCNMETLSILSKAFQPVLAGKASGLTISPMILKFNELLVKSQAELTEVEDSVKEEISLWFSIYAIVNLLNKVPETTLAKHSAYMEQILKYENPALRSKLIATLLRYGVPDQTKAKDHVLLFELLLNPLVQGKGISKADASGMLAVLSHKDYKDAAKKEKVIKGLMSLLYCHELNAVQKGALLKHIFEEEIAQVSAKKTERHKPSKESLPVYLSMQLLDAIIAIGKAARLIPGEGLEADEKNSKEKSAASAPKKPIDLETTLNQVFMDTLKMEGLPDFGKKYASTFGKAGNPLAWMVYATNLSSLKGNDNIVALSCLKDFVTAILEGNYKIWRYQSPPHSHLDLIFKSDAAMKQVWQTNESLTLAELFKATSEHDAKSSASATQTAEKGEADFSSVDVHQYLKRQIVDFEHLKLTSFPDLEKCLNKPEECKKTLIELSSMNKGGKNPFQMLEYALISLMNPSKPANKKAEDIEKHILPSLRMLEGPDAQILKDLESLKQNLVVKAEVRTKEDIEQHFRIENTDHWEDLLLCGTEVTGSCMRIGGDVNYNKGLLGYLADGKSRAVIIKDKKGKIVARCIIRLLLDSDSCKPVLFQETLYQNPGVPRQALEAINLMCERVANKLKFPLARSAFYVPNKKEKPYPHDLKSISSPAPFEYVDSGKLGITDGTYTIPKQHILFVPPEK